MDRTYTKRARESGGTERTAGSPAGPDIASLAAGARPSDAQMGSRVDLPDAIREKMESSFGADFSNVRLYESQTVADAGAEAVTQGSNIAFAPGKLDLTSTAGQALLGHELSHVVSQSRGESAGQGFLNDAHLEAQADRQGMMAAQGESVYSGPVSPIGTSSAASAAGPMQAKKGEKRALKETDEMKSDDFDELAQYSDKTGGLIYNMTMGTDEDRRADTTFKFENEDAGICTEKADDIDMGEDKGKLKGHVFTPTGDKNGKHVILYSGSGEAAAAQVTKQVATYTGFGYTVHVYDYRGYGGSTFADGKLQPSERSMMEDATAIYEHVLKNGNQGGGAPGGGNANQSNIITANADTDGAAPTAAGPAPAAGQQQTAAGQAPAPAPAAAGNTAAAPAAAGQQPLSARDILVHGYSMGGLAASHVARHAAINASKTNDERDKLGGLVLESSMRSFGNAAVGMGVPKFLESVAQEHGKKGMGEFDTESNLREAAALDRQLPVTFVTGSKYVRNSKNKKVKGDHLAEDNTHLGKDMADVFNQTQTKSVVADHFNQRKLGRTWLGIYKKLMR